jgi:hypothetical protein
VTWRRAAALAGWLGAVGPGCGAAAPAPVAVARGSMAYAVELVAGQVVSIELGERFEAVVRGWPDLRERRRIDLGPAEADVVALAPALDGSARFVVGGRTGEVLLIDADAGAVIGRWPHGAAITALRLTLDDAYVGDGHGDLCRRRQRDGALLVCAALGAPVRRLDLDDARIWVTFVDDTVRALDARTLAPARGGTAPAVTWRLLPDGVRWGGRRWRLAGPARGAAVAPDGRLLVATWIDSLDDASLVLLAPR